MKLRPFAFLFVMMTVGCGALFAGTTGKIIGQVKDANSGDPLPAVNIIIENTFLGASTDMDGAFMILNVPAWRLRSPGKLHRLS
ncbi:MAG: carboxypeptidase-like regulatory domain-containing protein [Calditrichia bacterium]